MSSSTERPAGSSVSADPSSWRIHPLSDPLQVGLRFLPCILKRGRRMSHSKGTRGGRPSSLGSSQAADELGSPPRPSRRPSARTVDRPKRPHSKDGRSRTSSHRTESRILTATADRSQYVGIDVSKATLDVAIGDEKPFPVSNSREGLDQLLPRLRSRQVALIVLEATGGL